MECVLEPQLAVDTPERERGHGTEKGRESFSDRVASISEREPDGSGVGSLRDFARLYPLDAEVEAKLI